MATIHGSRGQTNCALHLQTNPQAHGTIGGSGSTGTHPEKYAPTSTNSTSYSQHQPALLSRSRPSQPTEFSVPTAGRRPWETNPQPGSDRQLERYLQRQPEPNQSPFGVEEWRPGAAIDIRARLRRARVLGGSNRSSGQVRFVHDHGDVPQHRVSQWRKTSATDVTEGDGRVHPAEAPCPVMAVIHFLDGNAGSPPP